MKFGGRFKKRSGIRYSTVRYQTSTFFKHLKCTEIKSKISNSVHRTGTGLGLALLKVYHVRMLRILFQIIITTFRVHTVQ